MHTATNSPPRRLSRAAYRVVIEEPNGQTVEHGTYRTAAKAHIAARRMFDRMPDSDALVTVELL